MKVLESQIYIRYLKTITKIVLNYIIMYLFIDNQSYFFIYNLNFFLIDMHVNHDNFIVHKCIKC